MGVLLPQLGKAGLQGGKIHRVNLEDGAVLFGVFQVVEDAVHSQGQGRVALGKVGQGVGVYPAALPDGIHMGLGDGGVAVLIPPGQETAVILAGLHHHRKIGQLGGAVVNVQAVEVVLDDAGHRFPGGIAVAGINLHQHIKEIHQNVAAAGAGVDALDLVRGEGGVLLADGGQLGFHRRLLGGFLQIILPAGFQSVIGVALHPQPAQAVFHHIADNPVGGEQLGGCRDILFGDLDVLFQRRKDLVFFLAVIVLIQPADDLHRVLPVCLGDLLDHLLDDAAFPQQVIGEQQLGVVGNGLEHPRHHRRQGVALDNHQILEQTVVIVGLLIGVDLFHVQAVQLQVDGLGEDLGLEGVGIIGKHPHMGGQIAVHLHKTQGDEPVEPGIGDLLHHFPVAFGPDVLDQRPALGFLLRGQRPLQRGVSGGVTGVLLGDLIIGSPLADPGNQLPSGPDCILFDCVFIHGQPSFLKNFIQHFIDILIACKRVHVIFLQFAVGQLYILCVDHSRQLFAAKVLHHQQNQCYHYNTHNRNKLGERGFRAECGQQISDHQIKKSCHIKIDFMCTCPQFVFRDDAFIVAIRLDNI